MVIEREPIFIMFSTQHIVAVILILIFLFLIFWFKKHLKEPKLNLPLVERFFAITLLLTDFFYHVWMFSTDRWRLADSLPLELCSISLLVTIVLLWTGNKYLYPFVFFAGIGGALQAIGTPVLDVGFPHFRYFHFFYTHFGIVVTALYFTWVRGYRPTLKGLFSTMFVLNLLLPLIFFVNQQFNGNYMFLRMKPPNGSMLDFLGPYPWYILSLEIFAFIVFICLWLAFRGKKAFR